ncbi:MAG: hypothetical protein WCS42_09845 [Verrucomicrobiota bacterium]
MRKTINRVGGILICLVIIILIASVIACIVQENYDARRKAIIKQCESALPLLTRRYQAFVTLLDLCEKQVNWNDSFETFRNEPNPLIQQNQSNVAQIAELNDHDLKRFIGRIIVKKHFVSSDDGDYSEVARKAFGTGLQPAVYETNSSFIVIDFTELHQGVARFVNGTTAFEKVMGATGIEANLPQMLRVMANFEAINANELMGQLKADLISTDPAASAALAAVGHSVEQYNSEISHSQIAQLIEILPINTASKLILGDEGRAPN